MNAARQQLQQEHPRSKRERPRSTKREGGLLSERSNTKKGPRVPNKLRETNQDKNLIRIARPTWDTLSGRPGSFPSM